MIKNILFDWSGTISDDLEPVHRATMYVFRAHKIPEISYQEFKREFTYPYMNFYKKYSTTLTREQADLIFHKVIHEVGEPDPYPGAVDIVRELKAQGYNLLLLSGVPQAKLLKEVANYGLEGVFKEVVGSAYDKTLLISDLLKRHDFVNSQTVFVGDMVHDVHAGQVGGIYTVALEWGYEPKELLMQAKPDHLLPSILELPSLLKSWPLC